METANTHYSLLKGIKDDKFDVDHLENYRLTLHVGLYDFQIAIFDIHSNKCLLLEDYQIEIANNSDEVILTLSELFESHHLLKAGFWNSIQVSVKNNKCTLVPSELFEPEFSHEYLNLTCTLDPEKEEVHYFRHSTNKQISIFAADKKILDWLRSSYSNLELKVLHQSCAILEGIFQYDVPVASENMFIYLNKEELHLIVTSYGQLLYYNLFPCKSPEQFVRYVLVVFQELKLNQNQTQAIVWGDLDSNSPYYKSIYKYVRHVSFAHKPSFLKLNFQFDELHDHQYLDIYSTYLCKQ